MRRARMFIDLRQPTLVISGHWNPRIFGLDWVAQNLFQLAAGAAVEVGQVLAPDRPYPILFIDGVGVGCTTERLELFATDHAEGSLARVEAIAVRTLELLQHTPVFGFGANFTFIDAEVDAAIADALMTAERLEAHYRVTERAYQTSIALADDLVLNLLRHIGADGVQIAMNFHHGVVGADRAGNALQGALGRAKEQALKIMSELYDQDEFEIAKFGPAPIGEDNNVEI